MPSKTSVWDTSAIRSVVDSWYGVKGMPVRIQSRDDECTAFEAEHPEVPTLLWEYVNHVVRIVRMWAKIELAIDIVIWDEEMQRHRMIQDVVFKDAYRTTTEWYSAIVEVLRPQTRRWWVVTHLD